MYNYHTDLVWNINIMLFCSLLALAVMIILYIAIKEYLLKWHNRVLLKVKRKLYEMTLSGEPHAGDMAFITKANPRLFLDVETNRNREAVFFNEAEQELFKRYFITLKMIMRLEKLARWSSNKWSRIEAILSLGYAGASASLPVLEKSIFSKDEDVSYFSIISLGQIKTPLSAKILLNFLKKSAFFRYKIASLLESFPPEAVNEIIKFTEDADPGVRFWAVKIASKFKPADYVKKFEELTGDKSDDVRAAACECLGNIGKKDAAKAVIRCLNDETWFVRMHAVRAISRLAGDEYMSEIAGMVNDGSLSVLDSIKDAMTDHIEVALPYIEKFFDGKYEVAKRIGVEALERAGYVEKLFKMLLSKDNKESSPARRILEGMIRSQASIGLETALEELDEQTRKNILDVIKGISQPLGSRLEKRLNKEIAEP